MNKKQIIRLAGALSMSASLLANGDWRTPLSLMHSHVMRLPQVENAWWYDMMPSQRDEECRVHVHKWASLYTRSAGKAFQDNECCESNKVTRDTTSLATLFFGESRFKVAEAFPNGQITNIAQLNQFTPLINVSRITAAYEYNEKGICFGAHVDYTFEEESNWHVGGLIAVPICVVEVKPQGSDSGSGSFEETLQDLFKIDVITAQNATPPTTTTATYTTDMTIRYDLLNSLPLDEQTKLLRQDGPDTKIGFITVSGSTATAAQAYLIKESSTQPPAQPYRKQASQVSGSILPNGQGAADNAVLFIKTGTDLTQLNNNSNTQATLWVVPRAEDTNANALTSQAQAMVSQIEYAVYLADLSNRSVTGFLANQGLFLQSYERKAGLGDMKLAVYGCYHDEEDDWLIKIVGGTKCPTGTKRSGDEALHVTQLQTGNNRHWEIFAELIGGYQPCNWVSFDLSVSANHVFARDECMAASFKGATVKNLGPLVEGKISWDYFTAQANVNFFHPHNPELGCTLGYSLFAKRHDHVRFDKPDATDLFGNINQALDPDVAALKTKAMTHSIRGEIFHRWNYCELSAGGSYGVAGRNAMKETEAHIGVSIYF